MNVFNIKKGLLLLFIVQAIVAIGCTKSNEPAESPGTPSNSAIEKGVIKGRVTDSKANGIANVKLVVEHTIYYGPMFLLLQINRDIIKPQYQMAAGR